MIAIYSAIASEIVSQLWKHVASQTNVAEACVYIENAMQGKPEYDEDGLEIEHYFLEIFDYVDSDLHEIFNSLTAEGEKYVKDSVIDEFGDWRHAISG